MTIASKVFGKRSSSGQRGGDSLRYGVDLAKITNISDPENLNRVKCQRITVDDDVGETDWIYVSTPFGGGGYGMFFRPSVGDMVLLAYVNGDVHHPFVIGNVWNKNAPKAPYTIQDGKNESFCVKMPSGAEIRIEETKDKELISVTTKAGSYLKMDDGGKKLSFFDKENKNGMSVDLNGGNIELTAENGITLKAGSTTIELSKDGNITLKGSSKITLDGANINVKASANAEVSAGAGCTVKGNSQATLQSSGMTTVKGSMVKIN